MLTGCDWGHSAHSSDDRGSIHGYVLCVSFGRWCDRSDGRRSSKCRGCMSSPHFVRSCPLHPFELLDVHELLLRTDYASGAHDAYESDRLACGKSILPDEIRADQCSSPPQTGFTLFAHEIRK